MKVKYKNLFIASITGLITGLIVQIILTLNDFSSEMIYCIAFLSALIVMQIEWKYRNLISFLNLMGQKVHNLETDRFYTEEFGDDDD